MLRWISATVMPWSSRVNGAGISNISLYKFRIFYACVEVKRSSKIRPAALSEIGKRKSGRLVCFSTQMSFIFASVSRWVIAREISFQIVNCRRLCRDEPVYHVADRENPDQIASFQNRKMAHALFGHNPHALCHTVARVNG